MATFLEALGQVAKQTYCFALGNFDFGARSLGRAFPGAAAVSRVSGALKGQLCDESPDPIAGPPPDFTGGQCADINYNITWNIVNPGSAPIPQDAQRFGPLRLSKALNPGDANAGCDPSEPFRRFTMLSSGTPQGLASGCGVNISGLTVTPLGGEADDCGDPDPEPPPPPGDVIIEGDDITYEGDTNVSITVPTSFVFAPVYIALDGSIRVPVNIDVGGVEFKGELTVAPEFNLTIKPAGPESGPGAPDDPDGIGEPGEPSDPIPNVDDQEATIVGVLVFSDVDTDAAPSGVLFPTGPDLYVPRLASVQFAIRTQDSIGWTSDLDVKNLECYVPCPAPQGAIAVRVSPMPGVSSRFTAVRSIPLTSF